MLVRGMVRCLAMSVSDIPAQRADIRSVRDAWSGCQTSGQTSDQRQGHPEPPGQGQRGRICVRILRGAPLAHAPRE